MAPSKLHSTQHS